MGSSPDARAGAASSRDPGREGWTRLDADGFIGLVGPFWSKGDGASIRLGFMAEPRHANRLGAVQGGMLMTFADRGLGTIARHAGGGLTAVTISFEMQFVRSGRIGTFVELSGEVLRRTRDLRFMRGLVSCGSDTLASCQGVWRVLRDRSRDEPDRDAPDRDDPARDGSPRRGQDDG